MKQWHPLFAKLLGPVLEGYYEIQTNVPVSDVPREADLVLLRRTASGALPFQGLWKFLTTWNVLEFKGPTVSARIGDLSLLVELGLGIHRRVNQGRKKEALPRVSPGEVSFWYLTNKLGSRFLQAAGNVLGAIEPIGPGMWRCQLLRHLLFLVSGLDLPVDGESLPLHILGAESSATEAAMARLVFGERGLLREYGEWLVSLHPRAVQELGTMARTKEFRIHLEPLVDLLGMEEVIRQLGTERIVRQMGEKEILKHVRLERLLANMSTAQRKELKKRLLEEHK